MAKMSYNNIKITGKVTSEITVLISMQSEVNS